MNSPTELIQSDSNQLFPALLGMSHVWYHSHFLQLLSEIKAKINGRKYLASYNVTNALPMYSFCNLITLHCSQYYSRWLIFHPTAGNDVWL